jgi:hypothetical protein
MSSSLHTEAQSATDLMDRTVTGMEELQSTSSRMQEIIGTIDGISFQTNLLALNAAVEAARAGDQGRGFAVVASEVRALAGRSRTAAHEIRALIGNSSVRVTSTVQAIGEVNKLMNSLVTGISEIAMNINVMADGSAKQSNALSRVVHEVGNLDRVSSENVSLVEQSAHHSSRLLQRSGQLGSAVNYIQLRQGSADEAMALAEAAHALVQTSGISKAEETFRDPKGGYIDRDLHIMVLDQQGYYRVCGAQTELEGSNFADSEGIEGAKVLEELWQRADKGGGWVDFNVFNTTNHSVQGRALFVVPIDDGRLVLGCAAARSEIAES